MIRPIELTDAMRAALTKDGEGHKYDHGHALVLAGGPGRGGAARLAARAALRCGAGLVTLLCPQTALTENAAQLNAIMLGVLPDAYSLRGLMQDDRITALCLGPGLGLARAGEMVPAALWGKRPTLLDADALTAFASEPEPLFNALHPATVLTPHFGEFRALFPDLAQTLSDAAEAPKPGRAASGPSLPARAHAARAAAERAGAIVLLKGAETVIATPEGQIASHSASGARAAPWLATAGAGDVLAGIITGLMARGLPPFEAACTGTWLHVEAARSFGPGLIAEDLPEALPGVFRDLGI